MEKDKDKPKPKRVMAPKRKTIDRLDAKQEQETRLNRVQDMLNRPLDGEGEDVTIEEANKALEEAGFNPEEIRSFARFLVAQEQEPFSLPAKSPEHYTAIREEVSACVAKLKKAGANRWTIQQALEGRATELTTKQHQDRMDSRFADSANREGAKVQEQIQAADNGEEEKED